MAPPAAASSTTATTTTLCAVAGLGIAAAATTALMCTPALTAHRAQTALVEEVSDAEGGRGLHAGWRSCVYVCGRARARAGNGQRARAANAGRREGHQVELAPASTLRPPRAPRSPPPSSSPQFSPAAQWAKVASVPKDRMAAIQADFLKEVRRRERERGTRARADFG